MFCQQVPKQAPGPFKALLCVRGWFFYWQPYKHYLKQCLGSLCCPHGREIPSSASPRSPRRRQGSPQGGTAELLNLILEDADEEGDCQTCHEALLLFPWMFLCDFLNQGEPGPSEGPHWAPWVQGGKSDPQKTQLRFARAAQASLCQGAQEDPLFLWSLWDFHWPARMRIWCSLSHYDTKMPNFTDVEVPVQNDISQHQNQNRFS